VRVARTTRSSLITWVAWLGIVWCALIAVVRLTGWEDHSFLLIGLVAVLAGAMFPAYCAVAVGIWRRHRLLALVGAVLAACHLAWTVPDVLPRGHMSSGVPVRIYSHNILYSNTKTGGVASDIHRLTPDVVVLLELSQRNLPSLEPTMRAYPYRLVRPDSNGPFGFGIWSRLPFDRTQIVQVAGCPMGEVMLHAASRSVRLFAVHTIGPLHSWAVSRWRTQLAWLRQQARSRGDVPVVMAGDFNASTQHRDFRRLLDAGLTDAHGSVGGWAPTWPRTWWWLPPVMRIDHVLISPGIGVHDQGVVGNSGSDHAGLVTDLRL
jgi:endonuclease/exonuclease/phosphatase (EEP) superfamily protein YafD